LVKRLDLADFRAVRRVLEPNDFALGDDDESAPTDIIDEEAWHSIMTLPDDVAITTTSFQGSRIAVLHGITSAWTEVLPHTGIAASAMADVFDAFQASLFNQLHGFYKEAISAARTALETMTLATTCELASDSAAWEQWLGGQELRFTRLCDRLQALVPLTTFEPKARKFSASSIFGGEDGRGKNAWARSLYGRLSQYVHARGNTSNSELWDSNGPIYSARGFRLAYNSFLETHALCLILAKLAYPKTPLLGSAQLAMRADSLQLYLEDPHRRVCEFYVSELFNASPHNPATPPA
jgi:hypothetical protein